MQPAPVRCIRRLPSALLGAALAIGGARPLHAATAERITGLAAGASRLYALRANRVVAFDAAGRELGGCPRFEAPPPERPHPSAAPAVDADEALRLAGLPDDDPDSDEAEDVLEDEGLAPRRRRRTPDQPGVVARAIAASPDRDDVWIATSAGIYRGRDGACRRFALPGRDAVAVAAGNGGVAAATEDLLWRSDGDGALRVVAGLAARPRALAIIDAEHTLVASADDVVEIGPFGVVWSVLDRGSDALAVCGGTALALTGDGVWTWQGDAPAGRAGDRPPVRTVSCGDAAHARFIGAGGGLYTSPDGAAWREEGVPGDRLAGDAAQLAGQIWVAVGDRVVPLDDVRAPSPAFWPGPPALPPLPPLATDRLASPLFPWPQLTVVFVEQRTPLRDGWSVVLLLGFRFGRAAVAGADRGQLAAELVRRDAALADEEQRLSIPTDDDPSRNARLRAIRQEREALR